jgi:hypothetical protein
MTPIPEYVYSAWATVGLLLGVASSRSSRLSTFFIVPILMLATILLPTLRQQIEAFGGPSILLPSSAGAWLVMGWGLGYCLLKPRSIQEFLRTRSGLCFAFFVLITLLSGVTGLANSLWLSSSSVSLKGFLNSLLILPLFGPGDDFYAMQQASLWVGVFLFSSALSSAVRHSHESSKLHLALSLVGGFLLLGLLAIIQHFTQLGFSRDRWLGVSATFPDLHSLAGFLVTGVTLFLGYSLDSRPKLSRAVGLSCAVILTIAILFTNSRATLIFCALIWAVWLMFFVKAAPRIKIAVVSLLAGLAILSVWTIEMRGVRLWHVIYGVFNGELLTKGDLFSHRPEIWLEALREWSMSPVAGIGTGVFFKVSGLANFSESGFLKMVGGENAHGYFMQVLVESGILGLGALVLTLLSCALPSQGHRKSSVISWGVVGIAAGNIYNHGMLIPENALLLGLITALAARGEPRIEIFNSSKKKYLIAASVGLVCLVWFGLSGAFQTDERSKALNGRLCHRNFGITSDGWVGGIYEGPVPIQKSAFKIQLWSPSCSSNPSDKTAAVTLDIIGKTANDRKVIEIHSERTETIIEPADLGFSPEKLIVKSQHCFVPSNCTESTDRRRLGVQLSISATP